jgi:uncharacterized membrane-anchored protein YitT (DUF2179 family)
MRQNRNLSLVSDVLLLTVGALLSAFAVIVFMSPFKIAPSGVSGIAVIINYLDPRLPIGVMVLIGNIPIQILGYRMLGGWKVVAGTVLYIVLYSIALDSLKPFVTSINVGHDTLLNALFGGILGGIGGGLVYRAGGTLGGTSTLGRILQQKYGLPLSTSALYTDTGVILLAGLVFGWEGALYAIVAEFIGAAASDYVLEGPSVIRTATIITDKPDAIADQVLNSMGRGVTAWEGKGKFTEQSHTVLFVTVARPQVNRLRHLVHAVDPEAFMVIGQGHVAYGQGFRKFKYDSD